MTPKVQRNFQRIIPFGVIWLVTGCIFLYVEMAATGFRNLNPESAITLTAPVFIFAMIAVTLAGLVMGYVEVVLLEKRFTKYSLGLKVLYKFIVYLLFVFALMLIAFPVAAGLESGTHPFDKEVMNKTGRFFMSITFASTVVQIAFSIFLSLLYAAISENLGHQVLLNFFTGRYHTPVVEKRIFMFLDMKSSTTHAERLGHVKWFDLLGKYYDAMSDPIINHRGEVYQYIGDEIVVSWKLEEGIHNENCLRCFFAIGESLKSRESVFMDHFGMMPGFRAGIHLGEVTTGEIGALKKEIVFTGDVLNTTARIQALSKEYQRDLLISEALVTKLPSPSPFVFDKLGTVVLRGRSAEMEIYGVKPISSISE